MVKIQYINNNNKLFFILLMCTRSPHSTTEFCNFYIYIRKNTIIRKQREKRITGQTGKSNVVVRVYILMFQFW